MVPRTILDDTQEQRDQELARYFDVPVEKVRALKVDDMTGPPIWDGKDYPAESYVDLYEDFKFADDMLALKAFSMFIVIKRAGLIREATARMGKDLHTKHVLDFGCGVGTHGIHMLESGAASVDFLDVEGPALKFCKWRIQGRQVTGTYGFLYPGTQLASNKYDLVLCVDVLEHTADPLYEFNRIIKSMKTGAILCLQVGKHLNPHQGHFKQSRDIWLSKKTRNIRGIKTVKLSTYF